ncbi:MAG: ATP-binding protein [Thermodesulfobacteriota bacterium]|nr:ATP-binding protein [Thermodesulfobacteriota bacterium]
MGTEIKYPEVPVEKLRRRCSPESLPFEDTSEIQPCTEIIGQERALKAIRLGLEMESLGYNIFIVGLVGTGRNTTIKCLLEEIDKEGKIPDDLCYVNNFKDPDQPRCVCLPAGQGKTFKKDMDNLIESLKKNIPLIFESEEYQKQKREVVEKHREREKGMIKEFEARAKKEGFVVVQVQVGVFTRPDIAPLVAGNAIALDQLENLVEQGQFSKENFENLKVKYSGLIAEMEQVLKETRRVEKTIQEALAALDKSAISHLVGELIGDIREKYNQPKINPYLDEARDNILENPSRFQPKAEAPQLPIPGLMMPSPVDTFSEYQVNVLVDNSETRGAPVIIETSPTYRNLFGTIERNVDRLGGMWKTDFAKIKSGSFLRANGGYLVLNALDVFIEPGVWIALKRTLRNRSMEMQSFDPFYLFASSALKPEPIEVRVKVVMIGDAYLYETLYAVDEDFKKIFKIKADFDSVMERKEETQLQYAAFIRKICQDEKLLPFERSGVAAVIEYGGRLAGRQKKLSTEFHRITDILREASYWARKDKSSVVAEKHVDQAIDEKIYRKKMIEDKIQEMIEDGIILIDSDGSRVGQVNGLSVFHMGEYAFGKPSRITAKTSMGKAGIINIEREADLSGRTHNKGVLILGGYLRGKYAQDKPLTLTASLCFEQSYSGVEGDSASSTEVYAILSSLANLPLRQDIAVTGSVNQNGEIQPIGGVNQKIEGFFDTCQSRGLTGKQGVIIPHQNVGDLMLRKDVVQAVADGKFHVYPVQNIDQGIEILTGVPAGERGVDETYPEGTVNFLVDKKLKELAKRMKEFEAEEEKK